MASNHTVQLNNAPTSASSISQTEISRLAIQHPKGFISEINKHDQREGCRITVDEREWYL